MNKKMLVAETNESGKVCAVWAFERKTQKAPRVIKPDALDAALANATVHGATKDELGEWSRNAFSDVPRSPR